MTTIRDILLNRRIIVRLNGKEFCNLPLSEQEQLIDTDMDGCIIKRTQHGYLTVTSRGAPVPGLGLRPEPEERFEQRYPRYSYGQQSGQERAPSRNRYLGGFRG